MENSNLNKKSKLKNAVKTALILIVFAISYVISALTSSIYLTNMKLLTLFICFVCGIALFFILYGVLYVIALLRISKKAKLLIKNEIECNDIVSEYFNVKDYKFFYNVKEGFSKNAEKFKADALGIVKEIALGYGNHDDKYFYLSYTVYDAMEAIDGAIDLLDAKISPIFRSLRLEDKPLKSVEIALDKAINSGENPEQELPEKKSSFFKKAGEKIVKATAFIFRRKIESTVTDVVKFIAYKSFEVYSKSGNDFNLKESGGERL